MKAARCRRCGLAEKPRRCRPHWCNPCWNAYQRANRAMRAANMSPRERRAERKRVRARNGKYYARFRTRILRGAWKYRRANRERLLTQKRSYYVMNRSSIRETQRQYYRKNQQVLDAKNRMWVEKNRSRYRATRRAYDRRHPDYGRASDLNRRARIAAAEGKLTVSIVRRVRSAVVCYDCGIHFSRSRPITVGHRVPLARGGCNNVHNLFAQCGPCNLRQGKRVHGSARRRSCCNRQGGGQGASASVS
jgi:HNH endonuclease